MMRNTTKKRNIIFTVITIMLIGVMVVVAGCGEKNNSDPQGNKSKPSKLNMMGMRFGAMEVISKNMTEAGKQEDIDVSVKLTGWDDLENQSKVILSAGGNSPYEILHAYNGWLPEYIEKDWVLPLTEYYIKYKDKYELGDIPKELIDVVSKDGEIYAIPFQQNVQHLFYRNDLFEKYNLQPPKTFDDMFAVLDTLKKKGDTQYQFALALGGASGVATEFNNALLAYGGEWFDENGNPLFNSKEGVEAVKFLKKLLPYMPKEVLSYSNNDVSVALQQGNVAMANLWTTRCAEVEDKTVSRYTGKFGYAAPPSSTEGGIPFTNWTQDMFIIPKNVGTNPDYVFQIIAKTLSKENIEEIAPLTMVGRKSVADNPEIQKKCPNYKAAMETIDNGAKAYPLLPYMGPERLIVGQYVSEALAGKTSPEEALEKAEQDVIKDMKDKGYLK
ncbi:MAG: sugar ABC transporter substrate-binding protein [Dysgonamonadaceae bacterium]|jgi:multiple sugar transport system substrate-binding protein|nr:sugar ABC transporter substrate-binding protein [Syntrophaceticus schinkii]MDD2475797.1 sugar ABC transporter substrate-binding protein [Dysgonamonadaceae bacterium]